MNKLYSTKSNARRGAVKDLGPHAMEGADYKLVNQNGKWTWATIAKPAPAPNVAEAARAEDAEAPELKPVQSKPARTPRTRTKQSLLIDMLRRPEGATIAQIVEATGWRSHTARGVISGAIKKKLGLNVVSEKTDSGERTYRINDAAVDQCPAAVSSTT